MTQPAPRSDSAALFATLDPIRDEHARLLDADAGDTPPGREYWLQVHRFATCVAQSGVYFDEPHEVKACQGYLSYWERELAEAHAKKQFADDLRVPELKRFDEAALRALQPVYATNPFKNFAAQVRALASSREAATDGLAELIERKAAEAGLRFELDLPKEIANQVAGDQFAPTLLEFCLYHLFEDPETRIGNKLRRPVAARGFGCAAFLAGKAEQLYAQQGRPEKRALIDALARFGAEHDPRSPSEVMPSADIDAIRGASSETFKGPGGRTIPLRKFLTTSRLAFESPRGLSIVHPVLFRRWPELLSEIRLQKDRKSRRRRLFYVTGLLVAVGAAVWLGMILQDARERRRAEEANTLATHSYSLALAGQQRVVAALAAVETSPTRRARTALNDAIGAMLGADARAAEGKGQPLALVGPAPSVHRCPDKVGRGLCLVDTQGRQVPLPGADRVDMLYATDPAATLVAVAWPTKKSARGNSSEKVRLAVYRVGQQGVAEPLGAIRETACTGTVEHVRLGPRGQAVTVDCSPSDDTQPLWDVVALSDEADKEILVAGRDLEAERNAANALYFSSPGMKGRALLKDGGTLETTSSSGKPREFRSNILRVANRPTHLAFHASHGFAMLGALNANLAIVHEAPVDEEGRDDIYAIPQGLGDAWELDYSLDGKCLEVRSTKTTKGTKDSAGRVLEDSARSVLAYHIILDTALLADVARGLAASPPSYRARALCGFSGVTR